MGNRGANIGEPTTYGDQSDEGFDPDLAALNRTLGLFIRQRRGEIGLSLQSLADRVGCGKSYLSMIENGIRGDGGAAIGESLLVRLEGALELEPGMLTRVAQWSATPPGVRREVRGMEAAQQAAAVQLRALLAEGSLDETFKRGRLRALVSRLEGAGESNVDLEAGGAAGASASTSPRPPARLLPVQVPLVNSVAAGYPREFTDLGYPARVADEYVLSPDVDDPDAFAARVVGDSMEPDYREGDIVVFSPGRAVKSGMDCFVRLERDGETTFKRAMLDAPSPDDAGAIIRLVAINPLYGERRVAREDVAFMCPAVSVTRRIG